MVEPISIALISSAAAGIGGLIGRLSNRSNQEEELGSPLIVESEYKEIVPAQLEFLSVEDVINPVEIISLAKSGSQVFVSIKKMLSKADKLFRFLNKLNQAIEVHNLQLHQISNDLLLVSAKKESIQVRTLKRMADYDEELDDKLLHSSIAGY